MVAVHLLYEQACQSALDHYRQAWDKTAKAGPLPSDDPRRRALEEAAAALARAQADLKKSDGLLRTELSVMPPDARDNYAQSREKKWDSLAQPAPAIAPTQSQRVPFSWDPASWAWTHLFAWWAERLMPAVMGSAFLPSSLHPWLPLAAPLILIGGHLFKNRAALEKKSLWGLAFGTSAAVALQGARGFWDPWHLLVFIGLTLWHLQADTRLVSKTLLKISGAGEGMIRSLLKLTARLRPAAADALIVFILFSGGRAAFAQLTPEAQQERTARVRASFPSETSVDVALASGLVACASGLAGSRWHTAAAWGLIESQLLRAETTAEGPRRLSARSSAASASPARHVASVMGRFGLFSSGTLASMLHWISWRAEESAPGKIVVLDLTDIIEADEIFPDETVFKTSPALLQMAQGLRHTFDLEKALKYSVKTSVALVWNFEDSRWPVDKRLARLKNLGRMLGIPEEQLILVAETPESFFDAVQKAPDAWIRQSRLWAVTRRPDRWVQVPEACVIALNARGPRGFKLTLTDDAAMALERQLSGLTVPAPEIENLLRSDATLAVHARQISAYIDDLWALDRIFKVQV
jgi:hypothetical protein